MKKFQHAKLIWLLIVCILTVLYFFFIYQYNAELWNKIGKYYDILLSPDRLKEAIAAFGPYAPLAFILLQVVQVVIAPIPGAPVTFLGGYLFGVERGFVYSMIGLAIGSWLAFAIAGFIDKWLFTKFVPSRSKKKFDYLIGHEGVIVSFLLFLIPGFPKDALCYILGLTSMSLVFFLIISTIGRIPGTLIAVLQGAEVSSQNYEIFFVLLGISALVSLIFYVYRERIKKFMKKVG